MVGFNGTPGPFGRERRDGQRSIEFIRGGGDRVEAGAVCVV